MKHVFLFAVVFILTIAAIQLGRWLTAMEHRKQIYCVQFQGKTYEVEVWRK